MWSIFWKCIFTGREFYVEWNKENTIMFDRFREKCSSFVTNTYCFGIWRLIISKPQIMKGTNEVSTIGTENVWEDGTIEPDSKVCSLTKYRREVQGDRLRNASAEYGGSIKSSKA